MDIENIRTFMILANTKNYTRTAAQLFVAQSTVTNRINELEKELSVTLFTRNNRSVELTVEGQQFLEYSEKVIKLTDVSLSSISSYKKYKNNLRIGCADSIYEGHLAKVLLKHNRKHPEDALKIMIGMSNNLTQLIQEDIFDVVFSYLPLNKASFHCEIFKSDETILVTDYTNTKYKKGITREALVEENYLMCNYALQDVGQFIRGLFPKYHQFQLEIDDCSKVVPYLIGSENYTFLPKDMAEPYLKQKQLREVKLKNIATPAINSYIICKNEKWDTCSRMFMK
mgnify:CR=1 FL=1